MDERSTTNLRRKDTTRGPPLRILSLDGGGVRGYSMLIILQELMYRTFVETEGRPPNRNEPTPKPCDYFDLICGVGTGGLIAIMLGRLRLDLETCMDVYVRMTRRVFETDKTIVGIPYKSTLFKSSKLEDAIKACVKEHTIYEDEGNDGTAEGGKEFSGMSPVSAAGDMRRSMSVRSGSTLGMSSPTSARNSTLAPGLVSHWGNANASLYDGREDRTKTAVAAVYKGTAKGGSSILLRSYESRREPPPEFNCSIWQAGRATAATALAFKPIQIGQTVFLDEGAGKYNPSPMVLEEAAVNEWPGRDIGVFVSIGTGKRPAGTAQNQQEWWEGFVGGSLGTFAEARRRLIKKIEDCETTHTQMLNEELQKRGVPRENYCRLNVEVGVGEFGMNEWDRLKEMSTGTRKYLKKEDVEKIVYDASVRIAKIELIKRRFNYHGHSRSDVSYEEPQIPMPPVHPGAVELPAEDPQVQLPYSPYEYSQHHRQTSNAPYSYQPSMSSDEDKFMVVPSEPPQPRVSAELPYRASHEKLAHDRQHRSHSPHNSGDNIGYNRAEPPPIPPKTPINEPGRHASMGRPNGSNFLPYPDTDGPPPIVNKLRKPEFSAR